MLGFFQDLAQPLARWQAVRQNEMATFDRKQFVLQAVQKTLTAQDAAQVDAVFASDYLQHNPDVASGAAAQKDLIALLKQRGVQSEIVRVISEGDLVAIQGRYTGWQDTPVIAFDVFRVADGKLAEHWDNLAPEAAANPSGHSQIDGAIEIEDLDRTAANKAHVIEFITRALIQGEQIDYTQYIDPAEYVQHNSMVGDGLAAFGAFLADLAAQGVSMTYTRIHLAVAEGNFVLTASEGTFAGRPQAFYDLFRVASRRIVEHWDVIAEMPGEDAPHNDAGKF